MNLCIIIVITNKLWAAEKEPEPVLIKEKEENKLQKEKRKIMEVQRQIKSGVYRISEI
ncbi:MAG: hypothetical protein ACOX79_13385 [Methanosarcina sp.]